MKYLALFTLIASVSAQTSTAAGTSAAGTTASIPSPSASCVSGTSYCAGDNTPIILRCDDGFIQPGNCDDNTGEPANGALCVSTGPSQAYCSIVGSSNTTSTTSTGTAPIGTGTGIITPTNNGTTLSITPTPSASATSSGSVPVSTGAAPSRGVALAGVIVAAVVGGVAAL